MRSSTQNKKPGTFMSLKIAGHLGEVERSQGMLPGNRSLSSVVRILYSC